MNTSVFSWQEVDIGLAPDIGSLAFLPKITGNHSLVRELTYTARSFSANEAQKLGLVSKVVEGGREEVIKEALELARLIATKSPVAVASAKHLISHARDHAVDENLSYTAVWNSAALMTKVRSWWSITSVVFLKCHRISERQSLAIRFRPLHHWRRKKSYPSFDVLERLKAMSQLWYVPYVIRHIISSQVPSTYCHTYAQCKIPYAILWKVWSEESDIITDRGNQAKARGTSSFKIRQMETTLHNCSEARERCILLLDSEKDNEFKRRKLGVSFSRPERGPGLVK